MSSVELHSAERVVADQSALSKSSQSELLEEEVILSALIKLHRLHQVRFDDDDPQIT